MSQTFESTRTKPGSKLFLDADNLVAKYPGSFILNEVHEFHKAQLKMAQHSHAPFNTASNIGLQVYLGQDMEIPLDSFYADPSFQLVKDQS